ncbi:MAG: type II secretion system protein M [Candidatus Omnitrophica bacterium]|nr:type II secretion system protein M [Candidatus Omnitrophota bacterium]
MSLYLCLILGIGLYFFFFQFAYPRYTIINSKIQAAETGLSQINQILNGKTVIEKEYNDFVQKFQANSGKPALTDILQDVKSKAGMAGLNVTNVKPFPLKEDGIYNEFDFKLETEGELKNLGSFFYALDKSPYMFSIKHTQINAQAEGEPLKVQLLLSAILAKD